MRLINLVLFVIIPFSIGIKNYNKKENFRELDMERLNARLEIVKDKISSNAAYNSKIAFFVDMKIKSGKYRFFVYDLVNDEIIDEGLVAHGFGSETEIRGELKFSNEPNSKATSLGRYSIMNAYYGLFGKSYRLAGLDKTNSNALKRAVVLHSYSAVPESEQDYYIGDSHGCPMVGEVFFKRLEKIIDASKSHIILDIYY